MSFTCNLYPLFIKKLHISRNSFFTFSGVVSLEIYDVSKSLSANKISSYSPTLSHKLEINQNQILLSNLSLNT